MLNRLKQMVRTKGVITGFERRDLPLLMTYSRSGTNWIRYVVELLTGRPTPGHQRLHGGEDYVIDRAHQGYRVASEYERIILVVRNYKESLIRHYIDEWKGDEARQGSVDVVGFLEDRSGSQPPMWFIENVRAYHEFSGDKLLLYYEDLMTQPEAELRKLIEFLDLPRDGVEDLFENLDEHRQQSVGLYRQNQESYTEGSSEKLSYHSDTLLSDDEKRAFDAYYAERYPELYRLYLQRYATPD
jgi:hypothetical protein